MSTRCTTSSTFPKAPRILAVCLNPAWQKTLVFPHVTAGAVNRAEEMRECGGGKGVNLARALVLRGDAVAVALFAGGTTGAALLEELARTGVDTLAVSTSVATRVCTSVVDRKQSQVTELIEPSGRITDSELARMRTLLADEAPRAAGVAICGTCPPGVPDTLYIAVAESAQNAGIPVLLDGYRNVSGILEGPGVDILKINADELRALSGCDDLQNAAEHCLKHFRISWLAITDGKHPAWLFGADSAWHIPQPDLRVVNAIGAGDCCSGVFLRAFLECAAVASDAAVADAFARALACANATCLTNIPASFRKDDLNRLEKLLRPERMPWPRNGESEPSFCECARDN